MKKIVQYSQPDLIRLLSQDLVAQGREVDVHEFSVEFVTNANGETSALITGVADEDENVQESDADEGGAPEPLRVVAHDTVRAALNKEGRTVDEFVALTLDELEELGHHMELDEDETAKRIRVYVLTLLPKLEKDGLAEYLDEGELWRKKKQKKSVAKVTPLSTAAEIMGGDGGVMDRSDALSEGASEGRPRPAPVRRKKSRSRGGGSRGGGNRGGGFGSGTPFSF